ncbi:MAG: tetrahydromethanopterin S-methyltransferase subunit G [Candidatus Hecatellales archaeon]|nr:MAG: tetrahydromethanopterin S-methyltransferase subunit G [Candidatus Hecatellales archaeon]
MAESSSKEEPVVPAVLTPPEISELIDRLNAVDEKVEFVLGEMALRRGLKVGTWMGILYGFTLGSIICILLKFVVHWI